MVSRDTFTAEILRQIIDHKDFKKWLEKTDNTQLIRIEALREKIINRGLIKNLKDEQ